MEGSAVDDPLNARKDASEVNSDKFPRNFKAHSATDPDVTDNVVFVTGFTFDHHLNVFSSFFTGLAFRLSRILS